MTDQDVRARLESVVAITPAPFTEDGGVDLSTFERVVARMTDGGIGTLTVNGNTGEFYCLTPAESRRLLDAVVATAPERTLVVAGVGFDVASAIVAARYAESKGARSVMIHQPVHPYVSGRGWVEYHRLIAEAVPDLAVVPYLKNPNIAPADVVALAEAAPNLAAVKYALPDPVDFTTMARTPGLEHIVWITGLAELFAPAFAPLGATGFTSGLAAVAPETSVDLLVALRTGDAAAALTIWDRIREFERLRLTRGGADNVSVIKEALHQLGYGRADVRPPASRLEPADRDAVSAILHRWELR